MKIESFNNLYYKYSLIVLLKRHKTTSDILQSFLSSETLIFHRTSLKIDIEEIKKQLKVSNDEI